MPDFVNIDSGHTLSVFQTPGEDARFAPSKSRSLFTFGSFRLQTSNESDSLSADTRALSFGSFGTLETLNVNDTFSPEISFSVDNRELKLKKTDPLSYAYFSSFYTSVAQAINEVTETYPYAMLASSVSSGDSIVDYSIQKVGNTWESTFSIPYTSTTNQGEIVVNSGMSQNPTLVRNTDEFAIQLSGDSTIHSIVEYSFTPSSVSAGTSFMNFRVSGLLFPYETTATTFTDSIYVRPSAKRLNIYLSQLTRLQKHLLLDGEFEIPSAENPDVDSLRTFTWPRSIDGFNPDNQRGDFNDYVEDILLAAQLVDNDKTGIMLRTMIPENFLEQDSEDGDYRSLVETYAQQFDEIKQFIDTIAYAHTISYSEEENAPNKFLVKLSTLLGWQLSSSFNETDLFEYLVGDVQSNNDTLAEVNVEIWKRILINIIWLFKKKGTRDALQFMFKLLGAPDCLINLNEFVYDITRVSSPTNQSLPNNTFAPEEGQNDFVQISDALIEGGPTKVKANGYINYNASDYIFQEGGPGRGDGQAYINQWRPEFNPVKRVDNIKIQTGDTEFYGTENIVNTKEVNISIDPAYAIECDVLSYLQSTGTCWVWGTTGATFAFSALTVPFEYLPSDCGPLNPSVISGMTFAEFSDHIYANTVNPRDRKTVDQQHTSFWYSELKKIYLMYYYSNSPRSNRLTFKSLQFYVDLIGIQFADYFEQLIPATTIFQGTGTEYRNTLFNRQKFVYKDGINKGSEFQAEYTPPINPELNPIKTEETVNEGASSEVNIIEVRGSLTTRVSSTMTPILPIMNIPTSIDAVLNPVSMTSTIAANDDSLLDLQPFDFMIVRYKWTDAGGRDLDTRTAIVGSSNPAINGVDVGWSRANVVNSTDPAKPYLRWGGDNTSNGVESVLIDFKQLSEDLADATFEIRLRAFFYSSIASGDISLEIETYLGGEMTQNGFDFVNTDGVLQDQSTLSRNISTQAGGNIDGEDVGKIEFTVITKQAELLEP